MSFMFANTCPCLAVCACNGVSHIEKYWYYSEGMLSHMQRNVAAKLPTKAKRREKNNFSNVFTVANRKFQIKLRGLILMLYIC